MRGAATTFARTLTPVALAVLLVPQAARADAAVTVGPTRQLVKEGQTKATVYVGNPVTSDEPVEITATEYIYDTTKGWWPADTVQLTFNPEHAFILDPGEQREVVVTLPKPSESCRLMGAAFRAAPLQRVEGVNTVSVGLAQLAIVGTGGPASDCKAVFRGVSTRVGQVGTAGTPLHIPWLPIGVVVATVGTYLIGGWRRRSKEHKARMKEHLSKLR